MIPIWKDTEYTTSADTLNYLIKVSGETIFSARAYKYPDAANLKINVNKVCQDYLSLDLPDIRTYLNPSYLHYDAAKTFTLTDTSNNVLATYDFVYNYDYDSSFFDGSSSTASTWSAYTSSPINGHATSNMKVFRTLCRRSGSTNSVITSISTGNNLGYSTGYCGDYALIYSNSHGGFDSFLIEGNTIVSDDIESQEYNKPYVNTTIDFEKKRYISEITTSMEMHTGLLTDEQSENLATNLISTNYLYVQDLRTNTFYPALIKDTTVEHKRFKNGRKLNTYTINIELSQTKLRK